MRTRLGDRLIRAGLLTATQRDQLLNEQAAGNRQRLGAMARLRGWIADRRKWRAVLAEHLGVPSVDRTALETVPEELRNRVPAEAAARFQVLPIKEGPDGLVLATAWPQELDRVQALSLILEGALRFVLADDEDLQEALDRYYGVGAGTVNRIQSRSDTPVRSRAASEDSGEESFSEASIGCFFEKIILEARRRRATDVHLEPVDGRLVLRYRVDGLLQEVPLPTGVQTFQDALFSHIKIRARLNIAERRRPQDGRFGLRAPDGAVNLRVSILPTPGGESAVIRILPSSLGVSWDRLGLGDEESRVLQERLRKNSGILFVTGPTGSGKTTTLYACLRALQQPGVKIVTLEDPIEAFQPGMIQVQMNPEIGLSFAQGLRAVLRHDPDILMVGEVRDKETAETAVRVALTGHRVFSTLHTSDTAGGVARLLDMGIEPYLLVSAVDAWIAQRLVRRLCRFCRRKKRGTSEKMEDDIRSSIAGLPEIDVVYEPRGCDRCQHTGYAGREGVFEFLPMNKVLHRLILQRADAETIRYEAVRQGMRSLARSGWAKVRQGITSIEEFMRVIPVFRREGEIL